MSEGGALPEPAPQHAPGRFRRAWLVLTDLPPEDKRAEIRASKRERYLRRLRYRRVWRRRFRWIDPGKPPLTVMRWLAILGIALAWWANSAVTSPLGKWLPYAIIAGVLILPDLAGFAVGGLRVDMREAREDIARLRQDVNAQARATASATVGPIYNIIRAAEQGLGAYGNVTGAEREPQEEYVPRPLDTDGATEVRSGLWPTSALPAVRENR